MLIEPEVLGRLLIEAMAALVIDATIHQTRRRAERVVRHVHRNILHWQDELPSEQLDDMGD